MNNKPPLRKVISRKQVIAGTRTIIQGGRNRDRLNTRCLYTLECGHIKKVDGQYKNHRHFGIDVWSNPILSFAKKMRCSQCLDTQTQSKE
jgi:hypothetical protein